MDDYGRPRKQIEASGKAAGRQILPRVVIEVRDVLDLFAGEQARSYRGGDAL